MKKFLFRALWALLSIPIVAQFSGCGQCEEIQENSVLIVLDYTDKRTLEEVQNSIKSDFAKISKAFFPCVGCVAGTLKVVQVRDNCQNRAIVAESYDALPYGTTSAAPPPQDYARFLKKGKVWVESLALDTLADDIDNTCLYKPLREELNHLSQSHASRKVVILYSDMLENNGDISLYKQLGLSSDEIEKLLTEKYGTLPDLNGVNIYIINYPTALQDNRAQYAAKIWKEIFERRGAIFHGPASDLILK